MVDPKTRKQGNNFGILYCAAVWSGGAPLPFHDIIIPGKLLLMSPLGVHICLRCRLHNQPG